MNFRNNQKKESEEKKHCHAVNVNSTSASFLLMAVRVFCAELVKLSIEMENSAEIRRDSISFDEFVASL